MKTLTTLTFALVLAAGFGLSACDNRADRVSAAGEPDGGLNQSVWIPNDQEFMDYAAGMHAGEIKMAQLALMKSSNQEVRAYADEVIAHHRNAFKELSDKTGGRRVLDHTNASLDTSNHVEYLATLAGPEFDREFMALMIADHKDAARVFNDQIRATRNEQLKRYMSGAVPKFENAVRDAHNVHTPL